MRSVLFPCLAVAVWLAVSTVVRADEPSTAKLNTKIGDFTLTDDQGKAIRLYGFNDKKAVVVVFLSFECPVSNSYCAALAELHKKFSDRGVAFLAVNSSEDLDAAALARKAGEFKIPFPVLKDNKSAAADALKGTVASEAFLLDHNFVLRYRGRIDNGYRERLKPQKTTRQDLQIALEELLAGKNVSEPATKAVGCPLAYEKPIKTTGEVTYYKDVQPILQNSCQMCHRPGEVGPFALTTYKQAVNWASDIKEYTQAKKMPPWKPTAGPAFHNERKLADKDIATLAAWVDEGTPEGDAKDAPKEKQFVDGWQLGMPDLELTVPEEFTLDAAGKDVFRVFVLPTNLTEDKYVTAVEVRPGNPRVVHHSLNFFDRTGEARLLEQKEKERVKGSDEKDFGPGYSSRMGVGINPAKLLRGVNFGGLGGWAPGQMPRHLPEGTGWFLPKGSDVLVQLHYHRDGKVEKDKTSIGLYFAKKPIKTNFEGMVVPGLFLGVPAGDANFKVAGKIEVLEDCTLHSVMHHMHMLGKGAKVTVEPPDAQSFTQRGAVLLGSVVSVIESPHSKPFTLLEIKDWDYNWQETYWLKEPITIKKGTKISVEAIYDNSDKNPSNPFSPPKFVRFGEQTDNEMCFVFLGATKETPGRIKFVPEGLGGVRRLDRLK
jgi:peroxiredoxin/mono/diheme cytochrome c family protein